MMYSVERDHHHTAAARTAYDNASYLQPRAAGRSLQRSPQVGPAAVAGEQQQPRRASKKKHGARPPSRRSSTTVVATDVANFRAMVQELTGFPPAAVFRPLPRRVHAAVSNNPFVAAAAGQGCGAGQGRGQPGSETAAHTAGRLSMDAPAVQPVMPQCAPPSLFDELSDIGSPVVFDSWGDLSIDE